MSTKIEWTDETWNPVTGCTPVSPGCANCYARRMAQRLRGRCGYPADDPFRVTTHPERLEIPLNWRKPRRVFVVSMGDLFHQDVPFEFIAAVFGVMAAAPQHTFQVLTKRPGRMREWFGWVERAANHAVEMFPRDSLAWRRGAVIKSALGRQGYPTKTPVNEQWPLPNAWLGVSAEDQQRADERVPDLLACPAVVRFVSCEPLLGPVVPDLDGIDWLIAGAETGPGSRPMHPDWARGLRDQCVAAAVPFFFKRDSDGFRLLDGQAWEQWPEVEKGNGSICEVVSE